MSALFRKILLPVLLIIFSLVFTPQVLAQQKIATTSAMTNKKVEATPTSIIANTTTERQQLPSEAYTSPTSPHYMSLIFMSFAHTFTCVVQGVSVTGDPCLEYNVVSDAQGIVSTSPYLSKISTSRGLLGVVDSSLMALFNTPPTSNKEFLADLGGQLGFSKPAYAQVAGSGGNVLSPVFDLWRVSRNICYALMIVVFVLIGVMVMLRNKVNPQTVISVQYALPGLVMGLIFITFSYFLASLITDLAFLGTNMIGFYFNLAGSGGEVNLTQRLANENVISIVSRFVGAIGINDLWNATSAATNHLNNNGLISASRIVSIGASLVAYQVGAALGPALGAIALGGGCAAWTAIAALFTGGAGAIAGLGCGAVASVGSFLGPYVTGGLFALAGYISPSYVIAVGLYVISLFVVLAAMLRLLLNLINNYLAIIFYTITSPFYFLVASIPGRQDLATDWMRNMLCNVLAFPAVVGVLYFAAYILRDRMQAAISIANNPNPFGITNTLNSATGGSALPLLGGFDLGFINLILAFGALIAAPAIPDIICRAIGKIGPAGQLIGQELTQSTREGQGYQGRVSSGFGRISGDIGGYRERLYGRETQSIGKRYQNTPFGPILSLRGRVVNP